MTASNTAVRAMPVVRALEIVRDARTDEIVVTTMGSAREWPKLSEHPLDFQYLPSAMGHAPMVGLGLALAKPGRRVVAFNGDGGMLMSLGCLVTIVAAGAKNLTLIVLDNGLYEVTGGQATAGAGSGGGAGAGRSGAGACDFVGMARAAGFTTAERFDDAESWQAACAGILRRPGPTFVQLVVSPVKEFQLPAPKPMGERIAKFRAALA
jgi:thiamine pyrophosphate-dependent acetolactate synthase large subunit-like protein